MCAYVMVRVCIFHGSEYISTYMCTSLKGKSRISGMSQQCTTRQNSTHLLYVIICVCVHMAIHTYTWPGGPTNLDANY